MPKHTLSGRSSIKTAFEQAVPLMRHPAFDIKTAPAIDREGKLLIITPKVLGSAPVRNKIRRRLKAIFHEEKLFTLGRDVIVWCKKPSTLLSFQDTKEIILKKFVL
jgi:ribonuclease P protein component